MRDKEIKVNSAFFFTDANDCVAQYLGVFRAHDITFQLHDPEYDIDYSYSEYNQGDAVPETYSNAATFSVDVHAIHRDGTMFVLPMKDSYSAIHIDKTGFLQNVSVVCLHKYAMELKNSNNITVCNSVFLGA